MATRSTVSIVLAVIVAVSAIITLPGYFRSFYTQGSGRAILEFMENPSWDSMAPAERDARINAEGLKCAMWMTLNLVSGYLFVLITIGLLTQSITGSLRVFLRFALFFVWILGMIFLAIGLGYHGLAQPLPDALGPAFILCLAATTVFGITIGIGKLIQRGMQRRSGAISKQKQASEERNSTPPGISKAWKENPTKKSTETLNNQMEKESEVKTFRVVSRDGPTGNLSNQMEEESEVKTFRVVSRDGPTGVGGWLKLFGILSVSLGPLMNLWSLIIFSGETEQDNSSIEFWPELELIAGQGMVSSVLMLFFSVATGCIILSGRSAGKKVAVAYLSTGIIVSAYFALRLFLAVSNLELDPYLATQLRGEAIGNGLAGIVGCGLWLWYFLVSKRVRNTYDLN